MQKTIPQAKYSLISFLLTFNQRIVSNLFTFYSSIGYVKGSNTRRNFSRLGGVESTRGRLIRGLPRRGQGRSPGMLENISKYFSKNQWRIAIFANFELIGFEENSLPFPFAGAPDKTWFLCLQASVYMGSQSNILKSRENTGTVYSHRHVG